MTDTRRDRQTDGQTDRRTGKINMSLDTEGGRHNTQYNLSILKPMGLGTSKLYLIVFQRFVSTCIMIEQLTCASLP